MQAEGRRSEKARKYPFTLITYKHVHTAHSTHLMLPYIRETLPEPRLDVSVADANSRGIADGDWVTVFNDRGRFSLRATVSNMLRPGTLALPEGWWHREFREGHPSDLGHIPPSKAQDRVAETNYPNWDLLCEVRKMEAT
jgi:molybdopterin-containing oxidoreductase family molybdopterin binding subunit